MVSDEKEKKHAFFLITHHSSLIRHLPLIIRQVSATRHLPRFTYHASLIAHHYFSYCFEQVFGDEVRAVPPRVALVL